MSATRTGCVTKEADPYARYGNLLSALLLGFMLFDKAFAYLRVPGLPLFIAEMVLFVGVMAALRATGTFRAAVGNEPVLMLLVAFMAWGAVRTVPGLPRYGLDAVRDAALFYYGLFALLVMPVVATRPDLPMVLAQRLRRLAPLVVVWLAVSLVMIPFSDQAPSVPFSDVSVLSHKAGNAGLAALLVLLVLWLVPGDTDRRGRVAWSLIALLVLALVGTQNRGGLLAALAGGAVAVPFLYDRRRILTRAALVTGLALALALLLAVKVPFPGLQGREYSANQLVTNLVSLTGSRTAGNLNGTVNGREQLWTLVLAKQVHDGRLLAGAGFGPNLAAEVGVLDEGKDTLRSPHNSHLDVFARVGVFGMGLWLLFWGAWYWRVLGACRRMRGPARYADRQLAAVCLSFTTATLVSTAFDPQLEGPQGAALFWTLAGMALAVTGRHR